MSDAWYEIAKHQTPFADPVEPLLCTPKPLRSQMNEMPILGEEKGAQRPSQSIAQGDAAHAASHAQVCRSGFDTERGTFVQAYGSKQLDASLLLLPLVGFLPATDSRVQRTVEAIERELIVDGFVSRYTSATGVDGLPPGEGAFLACSFWLADNLVLLGRQADARRLFERLLAVRNDVGLLAEEYDPRTKRLMGNFPQAFSHVTLVNTAYNLTGSGGPAEHRCQS